MIRPWLLLPPSWAHTLSPWILRLYGSQHKYQTLTWDPFSWRDLEFHNRLGLAGGVDKNADTVTAWWTLGPGFVEVGTVTPKAQGPNQGNIIGRNNKTEALWNRMGFPNQGAEALRRRLSSLYQPHFTPIFVNIGKNRTTPIERAAEDYVYLMRKLKDVADVFVVNISSPNTANLRDLHRKESLRPFLLAIHTAQQELKSEGVAPPVLLKLSPDIVAEDLENVLEVSLESKVIDGWVLANTTLSRPQGNPFPKDGGLSGRPLAPLAKDLLKNLVNQLGPERKDKLIVSCGGIMSATDVLERLELGADLVQIYSALIFRGPFFFREVAQEVQWQRAAQLNLFPDNINPV
jgi:dihydroorotate dehydrogenase